MPSPTTTSAHRVEHDPNRKVSRYEKFVKTHYADARCVIVDNTYLGKTTRWYVIYFDYGVHIDNLGASRKNELTAWRNSVYWTKQRLNERFLKKLEA